jgi:hypothetical protein
MLISIIVFIIFMSTLYWYIYSPSQIACVYGSFIDPGIDACELDINNNYTRVLTQTLSTGPSKCPIINTQVIKCVPINGICKDIILSNSENNYTFSGPFLGSEILEMQKSNEFFALLSTTIQTTTGLNPNTSYYIGTLKTGTTPGYSVTPLYGGVKPLCSTYPLKVYSTKSY